MFEKDKFIVPEIIVLDIDGEQNFNASTQSEPQTQQGETPIRP